MAAKSLVVLGASQHAFGRHHAVRTDVADEVIFDRAMTRVGFVEQIALTRELIAGTLHGRTRQAQGSGNLVELNLQRELPERRVCTVEQEEPERLCMRRQRADGHHLIEISKFRDNSGDRINVHGTFSFPQTSSKW